MEDLSVEDEDEDTIYYANPVTIKVVKDELKANGEYFVGNTYELIYSLYNTFRAAISLKFNTAGSDSAYSYTNNCLVKLPSKKECKLTVRFAPKEVGLKKMRLNIVIANIKYAYNKDLTASAAKDRVVVESQLSEDLPPITILNKPYPLIFELYVSKGEATGVNVTVKDGLADLFELKQPLSNKIIRLGYPLRVEGVFKPRHLGSRQKVGLVLSYNEGSDQTIFSSETKVIEKEIAPTVKVTRDLPPTMKIVEKAQVEFTFEVEEGFHPTPIKIVFESLIS